MIFLLEYDPPAGRLITLKPFDDSERSRAHEERLAKELELNRSGLQHEVLLLEAASEERIRETHSRYFQTSAELVQAFSDAVRETSVRTQD